mmetsp:Transcript_5238/g.23380  ORF Transcript_5238/g.23380 Transcript_5238/m.23380 type:complete len:215 (+) Transcript_5238:535-1179(+)
MSVSAASSLSSTVWKVGRDRGSFPAQAQKSSPIVRIAASSLAASSAASPSTSLCLSYPTTATTCTLMSSFHGVSGAERSSHRTTPYEYTSAFSSKFSARNISGAIHSNVPWMLLLPDRSVLRLTRERPKSAIFTRHLSSTRMLGDLRSRWRMGGDREWRYCIPLATDSATWCVRGPPSGAPFLRRMLCREPRRMNSVAMNGGSAHQPMKSSRFG